MLTAFAIVAILIILGMALLWRYDDPLNLLIKLALFGLVFWGVIAVFSNLPDVVLANGIRII